MTDAPAALPAAPAIRPTPATAADPIALLTWHYEHPRAHAQARAASGVGVVGVTSHTVPWELFTAAGLCPVVLRRDGGCTPAADRLLEDGVFHRRARGLFEGLTSGEWPFLRAVFLPRTSEQEYKLFLYLRELARGEGPLALPAVWLYDLLQTRTADARAYGLDRTIDLKRAAEQLGGRPVGERGMCDAVVASNRARRAVARLLALRGGMPRLSGSEALALVGAFHFMDREDYATLANAAAAVIEQRRPMHGPRLLVKGASTDRRDLHHAIESHGAIVVGEDDWWGSRCGEPEIAEGIEPVRAIFEACYRSPSVRTFPIEAADEWFERTIAGGVDGVVFYLPPEDYVAGWDYPRQARTLERHGLPGVVVRADAANLDGPVQQQLADFVAALRRVA